MRINQWLVMAGIASVMSLGASQLMAQPNDGGQAAPGGQGGPGGPGGGGRQGRGNFDPAQFQQRMMDGYKQALEVTDDAEWKAMQPLVQKVMDARRDTFSGMGRGMFGRGGPRGGNNAQPADQQGQQRRGGFGGAPNPDADALQKAIDSKASKAELKAALDKRDA